MKGLEKFRLNWEIHYHIYLLSVNMNPFMGLWRILLIFRDQFDRLN